MDNIKDLSPLAKGDIEIGKALAFAIFDRNGMLLLAEGQTVNSQQQLDELAEKGLYHNPRWVTDSASQSGKLQSDLALPRLLPVKPRLEDPFETGAHLKMYALGHAKDIFNVRLIGCIPKSAVLITHPMRDGKYVFTKEGHVWDFQATYGLSIFHFSAMIEKVLLSPHPLLVMSWPHESHLESQVIRRSRRVACDLPATVRLSPPVHPENTTEPIAAVIDNLSTGGLELLFSREIALKVGQTLMVAFQVILDDRKYLIESHAEVVSNPREAGQSASAYGLAFKSLDNDQFAVIHAFVSGKLVNRLGPQLFAKP